MHERREEPAVVLLAQFQKMAWAEPPQNCILQKGTSMPRYAGYGFQFSWSDQRKSLCEEDQIENTFLWSDSITSQTAGWLLAWRVLSQTLHKPQASLLHWAVPVARRAANMPPIPSKSWLLSRCPFFPFETHKKLAKVKGIDNIWCTTCKEKQFTYNIGLNQAL